MTLRRPPLHRLLASLGLALFCHAATAQWELLGRNEDLRLFFDRGGAQRDGDVAALWQLLDYTSAQWAGGTAVMSVRQLVEYDCKARRMRTVAAAAYTEQMARGRQVFAEKAPNPEWAALPGGPGENLWRIACGVQ